MYILNDKPTARIIKPVMANDITYIYQLQASAGSTTVNYVTTPFSGPIPQGVQLPHIWNHNMVTVFPHGNAMATVSQL